MSSHGDINMRSGGVRTPGNTQEIIYNANGISGTSPNATFNIQSKLMSIDGNVRIANSGNIYLGGSQGNTAANSHFAIGYNVTATSIDFTFIG